MSTLVNQSSADVIHDAVTTDRASDNLAIHRQPQGAGGCTGYSGRPMRVVEIRAPFERDAYSRTVRIHELIHANRTKQCRTKARQPMALQAVEDGLVHSIYWDAKKMPNSANRDCLSVGLREHRGLRPLSEAASAMEHNLTLLIALRSMAIIERLGNYRHRRAAGIKRGRLFGPLAYPLWEVYEHCRNNQRSKAIKLLDSLMIPENQKSEKPSEHKDGKKRDAAEGDREEILPVDMEIKRLPLVEILQRDNTENNVGA